MSASKTNFFQGIALLLKEMSKTFTDLSKRVEILEQKNQEMQEKNELLIRQHFEMLNNIKQMTVLQGEIAQQAVHQHESLEELYKALGLKKDLSYYSFNLMNGEEH